MGYLTQPTETRANCRTFLLPSEDMCIHVIKTGFSQRQNYLVVKEDAYQYQLGDSEMLSAKEITEKYDVKL